VAVSAAISGAASSCNLNFNLTKLDPIEDEECERFLKSLNYSHSCRLYLGGAYIRCLCDPNRECCIYNTKTLLATVKPYCEKFSLNIVNNAKEICSDNKLCESINTVEAKKARQECYDAYGISVAEDDFPIKNF